MTATVPPNIYSLEWLENLHRATVSVKETSRVMNITERTVIRLIRSGELRGTRLGSKWFINRTDLIRRLSTE